MFLKLFNRLSITKRIAITSTLSLIILLLFFTSALNYVLSFLISRSAHAVIKHEMIAIQDILKTSSHTIPALRQELSWTDREFNQKRKFYFFYYGRVIKNNKAVIVSTRHMHHLFSKQIFPVSRHVDHLRFKSWRSPDGQSFILAAYVLPKLGYEIQLALDLTYPNQMLTTMWHLSLLVLLVGFILAMLLSYLIVKMSLYQIGWLTARIKRVKISNLKLPIDEAKIPTELRDLVRSFKWTFTEIDQAYQQLKDFAANLSHEVRTPLHILMGQTEVALATAVTVGEYRDVLTSNLEEFQRLHALVENLLFLAKADNRNLPLNSKPLNLRAEVDSLVAAYQLSMQAKNMLVRIEGNAALEADPILLRRVMSNLLQNAIKYSHANQQIIIRILEQNNRVQIQVIDQGIGIAKAHCQKIFDRFYRADQARSRDTGGLGLGLNIVWNIMQLHGGSVTVDSDIGKGSVFTLIF